MAIIDIQQRSTAYWFVCPDGWYYFIYNAEAIGNPTGHVPDKWYVLPYAVSMSMEPGEAFDSAEEAEQAVIAWPTRGGDRPRPT
ncbi:MAG: hypothetical protein JWN86_1168 [Planctomycetota bacterium]|nr:hypothetical protein [Planctomycetota bacterium]